MGVIRGSLFVTVSVLLFLSFLVGNVFLILSLSLDYDNVQPELASVVESIVGNETNLKEEVEKDYPSMELYCQNNSEYVFGHDESGQILVIPCDIVSQGSEAIIEYSLNSFVDDIYYKDYDCGFWDCFGKEELPLFLVSQKAKDYWNSKFYFSLILSAVLIALMFFLVEDKKNLPILAGVLLAISALPFMKINWVLSFIDASFLQFFTIFFVKAYTVFLISFGLGILLLVLGFILKLFGVGFKISELFDKFSKKKTPKRETKELKQEVSKSKKAK